MANTKYGKDTEIVWKDRKRWCGLPLSFTRYRLVKREGSWVKIFVDVGLLYSVIDEVNMYRVCDITFSQSLFGKLWNTGTIVLHGNDSSKPNLVLKNVKNPYRVRNMLSTIMEEQRRLHNVRLTEFHSHDDE